MAKIKKYWVEVSLPFGYEIEAENETEALLLARQLVEGELGSLNNISLHTDSIEEIT